jgi:SAM-dependent methyltransferase
MTEARADLPQSDLPVSDTAGGEYSGTGVLRLVEAKLHNYNASIVDEIVAAGPGHGRILDFGAGIGTLARGMRARGFNVDCVEPDAAQRAEVEAAGFRCYTGIADVPASTYDYIYSSNVLEHIDDDVAALRALHRTLKPAGTLLLYVPAFGILFTINDKVLGHHRRYTGKMLRERLTRAGFTVQSARYSDFLGFFVTLCFKLVSNKMDSFNTRTVGLYDGVIFPISRTIERFVRLPVGKNLYALARRADRPNPAPSTDD